MIQTIPRLGSLYSILTELIERKYRALFRQNHTKRSQNLPGSMHTDVLTVALKQEEPHNENIMGG